MIIMLFAEGEAVSSWLDWLPTTLWEADEQVSDGFTPLLLLQNVKKGERRNEQ